MVKYKNSDGYMGKWRIVKEPDGTMRLYQYYDEDDNYVGGVPLDMKFHTDVTSQPKVIHDD